MSTPALKSASLKLLFWILTAALLAEAATEFHEVALGTGAWLGGFSPKWAFAFLAFVLICALAWLALGFGFWKPAPYVALSHRLPVWRGRLGVTRWLFAVIVLLAPIWFFEYSPWGVVFSGPWMRLLIWGCSAAVLAFLLAEGPMQAWTWNGLFAALLLSGAGFVLAAALGQVTSYPFALGWSEGNRLWDYSLLFGLHLYQFAPTDPPAAYLEPGRQIVGALPFLLPHISIAAERLWLALMDLLPYLILGWLAFRPLGKGRNPAWILAGIWGFVFLNQGPIHAPLLVCAILVALAWGQPTWLAASLVFLAGYFAEVSRYTWIFAPAIWAVMLEFGSAVVDDERVPQNAWTRAISMGVSGLLGSLALPKLMDLLHWNLGIQSSAPGVAAGGVSIAGVASAATKQPLLWYRLFPNATFGSGILLALLLAAGPLVVLLIYLSRRHWKLNLLQRLALGVALVGVPGCWLGHQHEDRRGRRFAQPGYVPHRAVVCLGSGLEIGGRSVVEVHFAIAALDQRCPLDCNCTTGHPAAHVASAHQLCKRCELVGGSCGR